MRNTVNAVFEPEMRFEVNPTHAVPFRAVLETEFERLTARLLRERLADRATARLGGELRRAANEAAALAWATAFPLLFFPTLFEEKVRTTHRRPPQPAAVQMETRAVIAV